MYIPTTVLAQAAEGSLDSVDYTLGADVPLTADVYANGPSGSFVAGTWYISWRLLLLTGGADTQALTGKLWDGAAAIYDENELETASVPGSSNLTLAGFAVVVLGSTTTITASMKTVRSGANIQRDIDYGSASAHTASRISGIKIA